MNQFDTTNNTRWNYWHMPSLRSLLGATCIIVCLCVLFSAAWAQEAKEPKESKIESSAEAATAFVDAANLQNNGAYDVATEEWEKFITTYPNDPLVKKAQHYLGVCLLQQKQFAKAATIFQAVVKFPKFELAEDAYLNLGSCQYSLAVAGAADQYAAANETFAALAKQFPQGKYLAEALFFQGKASFELKKYAEAAAAYTQIVSGVNLEKSPRRAEALFSLGTTQEELAKFPEAEAAYDKFLKEFADHALVVDAKLRKAEMVLKANNFAAAGPLFAEVAAVKDFADVDYALCRQAFCLTKQDKFLEAGQLYAKAATDFPTSQNAAGATASAGWCFFRADKADDATAWLNKAIAAKNDRSAEASHWLCRLLLKSKKGAEAATIATQAIAAGGTSSFLINLKLDQADALFEIPERRAEALAAYAKFATENAKSELAPQVLYNAAYTALELKQFDEGLKQTTAFVAAYPQDKLLPDVKYVAAECNLLLKNYPAAELLYKDLTANYATHSDLDLWRVRFGLVQYIQKKYAETIAALTPAIPTLKNADATAEAQFLVGASQFYTDKFAEAEAALTASVAANPKWRQADEAYLTLARAQRKLNKAAEGKATIVKVIAEFPASTLLDQAHYRLGEILFAADDFPAALAEYDVVIAKWADSPFVPYSLYGRSWSLLKTKQFAPAIAAFSDLLTKYPQHTLAADASFGRATARRLSGDFKGTIDDLKVYLTGMLDAEKRSDALYDMALAQVELKDFAGAATTLDGLLKADAKYARADKVLYELAWATKSQDKAAEAVPLFAKLAAEYPASPLVAEAWFHVAEDSYDKKNFAEASKAYLSGKEKKPIGELAEKTDHKLGWAYFQQKQYPEALKCFTEHVSASPTGPLAADGTFMKAECFFRQQNYTEALPVFKAALAMKSASPDKANASDMEVLTLLHGGQSASQLKQWPEAIGLLAQIGTRAPTSRLVPEAMYELGWAKQNSAKADEALKDYEVAATKSRDQVGARARFMMGEIYFEKKQHNEAIREFQRAMFGFLGEKANTETKNWQAKSGFEAGRCAEVQIEAAADPKAKAKLIEDAKRFYAFVVEKHPTHELVAKAKERLEAISRLK